MLAFGMSYGGNGIGRGGGGRGGGKGCAATGSRACTYVYVVNLSWETGWQDLKDHFRAAGDVTHADIMQEHDGRAAACNTRPYRSF